MGSPSSLASNQQPVKPDEQLQLTEKELKEEITRILTADNPNAPRNLVRYDFKERQYKLVSQVDQVAYHFISQGNLIHMSQLMNQRSSGESAQVQQECDEETLENRIEKKIVNQFTSCDRCTQTFNNPLRDQCTKTEPPPRSTFAANATQWVIYDFYQEDYGNQRIPKKRESKIFAQKVMQEKAPTEFTTGEEMNKIGRAVKILERMVNQSTFDGIAQDYKYYEDPSDEFRGFEGTLLPLWIFSHEATNKLSVTSLCWSPKYSDLFVVGHGSYEFIKDIPGLICFYSLKNPCYPEFTFATDSGVLCLDIHPDYPHMLCVGFYNGSVSVFNVIQQKSKPLFLSTADSGKHTDPVWNIRWQKATPGDSNLQFYSVSSDGRVTLWTLIKEGVGAYHDSPKDLIYDDVIKLQTTDDNTSRNDVNVALEGTEKPFRISSGTTFDFHRTNSDVFLVGTEEGLVHKCSRTYNSRYLETYKAHHLAVYRVAWNHYHSDIFITCSADWNVKMWNHNQTDPVFVYDLHSPVGDVAWAPYSSTVFAAATADGKVHVYDLSVDKYEAICVQVVVQKRNIMLTQLVFNPRFPILIVGDNKGNITSLKLSPNLRRAPREIKGPDGKKKTESEKDKLAGILRMVG